MLQLDDVEAALAGGKAVDADAGAADDDEIVVDHLLGTHRGPLMGFEPTGREFRVRMAALFFFDDTDRIVCERVYFDSAAMLSQLGLLG